MIGITVKGRQLHLHMRYTHKLGQKRREFSNLRNTYSKSGQPKFGAETMEMFFTQLCWDWGVLKSKLLPNKVAVAKASQSRE